MLLVIMVMLHLLFLMFLMGFKAFSWNVRGLCNTTNQDQVIELLREDNYSLCGLLETHVKKNKLAKICRKVLGNWDWASNNASCSGGTRIVVRWNPNSINLMVLEQTPQVMHCFVESLNGVLRFHCSFIYAHNHTVSRRSLWKSLQKFSKVVKDSPWIILGDFNATLDPSEKSSGGSKITTAMSDFRDCMASIDIEDLAMSGLSYTWNKRPGVSGGLLKKLDRVMGNLAFVYAFPTSHAQFLPFMTSDHSPASFTIPEVLKSNPKPFKFHNYLSSKEGFLDTVKGV